MLLTLLFAAALPSTATAPPAPPPCRRASTMLAGRFDTPRPHPLGDEPPAQQIRAVLRTSPDGCIVPMVVRAEVGQRR